jgi:hypothetical protein
MATFTGRKTSADQASPRLETIIGWTWRDRARQLGHQLRAAVGEMNYATRRTVELQMRVPR